MLITDYLRPENILFQPSAESKDAALRQLVGRMVESGDVADAEDCLRALTEREKLMTTGVGHGVALPHAFSSSAPDTVIAHLRVLEGVDFSAVDGKPVRHIFCILGPPKAQGRHLKILARLARLLNHPDFVRAIDEAQTPEDLLAAFRAHEQTLTPHTH